MEPFGETLARLSSAQKTAKGAPAYSRFVNRKAGRYLAVFCYRLHFSPAQVTSISALFSLSGILLLVSFHPSPPLGLAIMLLLAIGYAFDSADGQLARLQGGGTPAGEWLDHVVDSIKISSLHLAVLVSFYRFGYALEGHQLLVPVLWALVAATSFFVIILNDQIRRTHGTAPVVDARAPVLRSLLVAPTDYGVLVVSFVLYGWHAPFLVVYAVLLVANAAFLALALVKWYREISALSNVVGRDRSS